LVPDPASPLFRVQALQKVPHLVHAITRRRLQAASPEFDLKRGNAAASRAEFARQLGIKPENAVWLDPDESGKVQFISEKECGRGAADWNTRVRRASGLVTDALDLFLCTLYNDNAVVLLFDPRWYGVGLVNIKPTEPSGKALVEAVELITARGGAKPDQLTALIAPSVGPCCHTFRDPTGANGTGLLNLWDVARGGLMKAGLPRIRIFNSRVCTACRDTEFFSQTADGTDGGAGAVAIGVRSDGVFGEQLVQRRASIKQLQPAAAAAPESPEVSLMEEQRRLNALVRCPYGQKKVYVRSVLDGRSAGATKPEIALRCAVMREMGHAVGGFNIVTRDQIIAICCADYAHCPTYQELARRQNR